jgi:hypothetical protein
MVRARDDCLEQGARLAVNARNLRITHTFTYQIKSRSVIALSCVPLKTFLHQSESKVLNMTVGQQTTRFLDNPT